MQTKDYPVKLVRDRIGDMLEPGTTHYETIKHEEHLKLLRGKLIEEAAEYLVDPSLEELADVLEVIEALCTIDLGCSRQQLEETMLEKRRQRGGFVKGVVLINSAEAKTD